MRGRIIELEVIDKRGKAAKTIPLYQYDYGQKLLIKGVELPEYYEVHFSNQQYGDAVTVLGDSTGVLIPDSLVATGETIYVWLFLHDTSYDGETEYMGAIPVIKRAQPTDITPTPEEQSIITEVIAALNNMEDDMSAQVQAAEAAKEAAQTAQTAAEGAATTASGYVDTVTAAQTAAEAAQAAAETAATSATASATSATSSANSANNALAEATNAKIAAVDAASAASTSATTATTASGNASNYATSAESAKVDAVAAQTAAEAAQTAAETAQGKAEDAQGAAETAQTAAETAQGKAEDAQEAAEGSAEDSEAYAVGTRNGVDVESDDPAYENNAKYYAEEAATVLEDKLDAPATAGAAGQVLTSDGEGGQAWADPSGAIDDTAGEGDTDVTWSADKLAETTGQLLTAIQGVSELNVQYASLLGELAVNNVNVAGGSGEKRIIDFNTKANTQYVITIKLKQAVSKMVYYGFTKPDGTLIGYASGIDIGNTTGVKVVTPTEDYIGAHVIVACSVDFTVEKATIASYSNVINDIANAFVGDEKTELTFNSTSQKIINGNGEVANTSDASYYVTDEIEIIGNRWYQLMASSGYSNSYYAIYDENHNVIDYMRSPGGSAVPIVNKMIFTPLNAKYIRLSWISTVCGGHIALCNSLKPKATHKPEWLDKFMTIGYSNIGVAATNSLETYLSVGHFGFNACKGDVRPTSDGKLIMCHDPGFTFDGNGRITTYNASSRTLIHSLTHAQCMELEYDGRNTATENNHYQKVADIDGYLDVCKQYDMIAFITVRDEYPEEVASEVIAALKRHNMTERAIINGYTAVTNAIFRFYNDNIPISFVQANDATLTNAIANRIKPFGNAIITLVSSSENMETYLTNNKTNIEYAVTNGVYVMYAQPQTMEEVYFVRNIGISGAQIGLPVLPYIMQQVRFKIEITSGTPELVEWRDLSTMDASVSASGNVISVSEFTIAGSTRGFPDLIMEYWMNRFAKRIMVESANGNTVSAKWQNNALKITVSDISVNDTIDVIVEV